MKFILETKTFLTTVARENHLDASLLQFPDCDIDPEEIKAVMISEVSPPIRPTVFTVPHRDPTIGTLHWSYSEAQVSL